MAHIGWEENVTRPRAADDFAMIRARMEELRCECAIAQASAGSDREPAGARHHSR